MDPRQPLPRLWLLTDERMCVDGLARALERLPAAAGIVFRHYHTPPDERRRLFDQVRAAARAKGQLLLLAAPAELAAAWGADGSHGRGAGPGVRTAPVHNHAELQEAQRSGAALVFISPVFATRSHAGAPVLGPEGFARLARATRLPAVALGGMDAVRFDALEGAYGWAGIDAWSAPASGRASSTSSTGTPPRIG